MPTRKEFALRSRRLLVLGAAVGAALLLSYGLAAWRSREMLRYPSSAGKDGPTRVADRPAGDKPGPQEAGAPEAFARGSAADGAGAEPPAEACRRLLIETFFTEALRVGGWADRLPFFYSTNNVYGVLFNRAQFAALVARVREMFGSDSASVLMSLLTRFESPRLRNLVLMVLAGLRDPAAEPLFVEIARRVVSENSPRWGDDVAPEVLLAWNDFTVAVCALGLLETESSLAFLREMVEGKPFDETPEAVRAALAQRGSAGLRILVELFERASAGEEIPGWSEDRLAGDTVSQGRGLDDDLDDVVLDLWDLSSTYPHASVQRAAISALGQIGGPVAFEAIMEYYGRARTPEDVRMALLGVSNAIREPFLFEIQPSRLAELEREVCRLLSDPLGSDPYALYGAIRVAPGLGSAELAAQLAGLMEDPRLAEVKLPAELGSGAGLPLSIAQLLTMKAKHQDLVAGWLLGHAQEGRTLRFVARQARSARSVAPELGATLLVALRDEGTPLDGRREALRALAVGAGPELRRQALEEAFEIYRTTPDPGWRDWILEHAAEFGSDASEPLLEVLSLEPSSFLRVRALQSLLAIPSNLRVPAVRERIAQAGRRVYEELHPGGLIDFSFAVVDVQRGPVALSQVAYLLRDLYVLYGFPGGVSDPKTLLERVRYPPHAPMPDEWRPTVEAILLDAFSQARDLRAGLR